MCSAKACNAQFMFSSGSIKSWEVAGSEADKAEARMSLCTSRLPACKYRVATRALCLTLTVPPPHRSLQFPLQELA